jgi:hypothetical protein
MLVTYRLRCIIGLMLLTSLLVGCAEPQTKPVSTPTPGKPIPAATTASPISVVKPELEKYFQGFKGAFVIYDRNLINTFVITPTAAPNDSYRLPLSRS